MTKRGEGARGTGGADTNGADTSGADTSGADKPAVTRRDALKLASAMSALGVGLGVTLETTDAEAATVPLTHVDVLSLKLYKLAKDGSQKLVHSFDLGALSHKGLKDVVGQYTLKLTNLKLGADSLKIARSDVLAEQSIELTAASPKLGK